MQVPPFSLNAMDGSSVSFPSSGRQSVVCFVKEDCPTCREIMPVLAAVYRALSSKLDVHIIGQTLAGNAKLASEFDLPFSLLDDSSLKVSFASDIDTVPTLFCNDEDGKPQQHLVGFVREEWQTLLETVRRNRSRLARFTGMAARMWFFVGRSVTCR